MHLISIAMTTYNGEKFIRKQLDSILNQSYKNIEIVICDDGSTDNTISIIKEYTEKYQNIRLYINETNLGFAKNFEKAISLCNGEYIALADQDDIWLNDKIEKSLEYMDNADVVCSACRIINGQDEIIHEIAPFSKEIIKLLKNNNYDYRKTLTFGNVATGCTMLIKKSFVEKFMPIPQNVYHDWWIAIIAAYNNQLKYIEEPLILYRHHDNNETAKLRVNKKKNIPEWFKAIYILYDEHYQLSKIKYCQNVINLLENFKVFMNTDDKDLALIEEIISLNKSVINFKFSINDFKLILFQYKNLKYISSKKNYFPFNLLLRFILKAKKH